MPSLHQLRLALNGRLPPFAKRAYLKLRELNAGSRALPDFLIIGAQKAGTTSLFNYLCQHPHIIGSVPKEIMFFTAQFDRGEDWYRRHFPKQTDGIDCMCAEATPTYLYSADAAERSASLLPKAKLIAILREPASRAISHYHHQVRSGVEMRSIDEVFSDENMALWEAGECPDLHARYYFKWSDYATGLKNWLAHYPPEQLLVLKAEQMFADPNPVVNQVCEFLQVEPHPIPQNNAFNVGGGQVSKLKNFDSLKRSFARQNEALVDLGYPMSWS
jgi:hypothetical protein